MIDDAYLTKVIQQCAREAMDKAKLTAIVLGRVTNIEPLEIALDGDKLKLPPEVIIVSEAFSKYEGETLAEDGHTHKFEIDNRLKVGDKVRLLRNVGGQLFYVLGVVK